jgi:large subunit ribosomal protein L10
MSKYVKELLRGEMTKRIQDDPIRDFLVVRLGLDGVDENRIRGALRSKDIRLLVTKNSIFRQALNECSMEAAVPLFCGQCAVVYGSDSVVDVAKEIVEWCKKTSCVEIKGGFLDGEMLDSKAAEALAGIPSRSELQGRIVSIANAPGARLAAALTGPWSYIAGCIKAVADRLEKESK